MNSHIEKKNDTGGEQIVIEQKAGEKIFPDNIEGNVKPNEVSTQSSSAVKDEKFTQKKDTTFAINSKDKKAKKKFNDDKSGNRNNKMNFQESMQTFEEYKGNKQNSLNLDLPLKYLTKQLLNSMGYFCELEVNIFTQSFNQKYKKEQISDIDVLGIKFENDLSLEQIPVECKSGEDGALEELLKLKGVMEYLGCYKGYLVKSKIANNAREMGEKIRVSTFDIVEIKQVLSNLELSSCTDEKWIKLQLNNYLKEKYMCERAYNFSRPLEYLKNEYWHNKNFRNIHNLIFLVSSQKDSAVYSSDEGKYTVAQLAKYLSLSLLKLCSYIAHKNFSNPVDKVKEYMFGGAREKREREVLFDKVNQVLAGNSKSTQRFEPDYIDDIIEICIRLMSAPHHAKNILFCFDYYIQSNILRNDGYDKVNLTTEFSSITLKFVKDVLVLICKRGNIKIDIFDDIFSI